MKRLIPFLALVFCLGFFSSARAADLVITAANVKQVSGVPQQYTAGATITAGQVVYLDSASSTVKLSKASSTTAIAAAVGIALNGASSGQPVIVLTSGQVTIGATTAAGTIYVVSANAGNIAPWADLVNPNVVTVLGYGASNTTDIVLSIIQTGVTHP